MDVTAPVENSNRVQLSNKPISNERFNAFTVAFGGVGLGLTFSWTATALPSIDQTLQLGHALNATEKSLVGSLLFVGALLASPIAAIFMKYYGRKRCLLGLCVVGIPGWLALSLATNSVHLYAGRLLIGVYAGGCSTLAPVYVKELSSLEHQGMLGSVFSIMICTGSLIANLLGTITTAKIASLCYMLQPVVQALLLLRVPDTNIVIMADTDKPEPTHQQLRQKLQLFFKKLKNIKIACVLMLLAQFCGINVVNAFANEIVQSSHFLSDNMSLIALSTIQVIGAVPNYYLIDKLGRKSLLISSLAVMSTTCALLAGSIYFARADQTGLLTFSTIPIFSLSMYLLAYSWGVGSVTWTVVPEIIPSEILESTFFVRNAIYWSSAFFVTFFYQITTSTLRLPVWLLVFSMVSAFGAIFITLFLPETKEKSTKMQKNEIANTNET